MESASKTLKRITLELGGKDPAIVCKSVDIKEVAPKIATLAFLNSGQICLALKRIYIHADIYNEFRDAMVEYTKTLQVGDGTTEGVFLGAYFRFPKSTFPAFNHRSSFLPQIFSIRPSKISNPHIFSPKLPKPQMQCLFKFNLGPIQNNMQYTRVQTFFDDIESEGLIVAGGGRTKDSTGYFINPTIIDNPSENSRLVQEEPFGMYPYFKRKGTNC
jgi:acyl-CoA reductase-like NAD-dependent aldehyde dehydrogenase